MAKKKRKHFIKLNTRVRELFNGQPFDAGITTLSDDLLMELVLLLGLESTMLERDEAIRALRRIWSEGEYRLRKEIINHLVSKQGRKGRSEHTPREDNKVDHIIRLLASIEHTPEEEQEILESFIDSRASKITPEKIKKKLDYLRLQKRITTLEGALGVTFDSINELEFYHSFPFALEDVDFNKTLLVRTRPINLSPLLSQSDEEIVRELSKEKEDAITKKSNEIAQFLSATKAHRYLDKEEVYKHLKRLPADGNLWHNPIDPSVVESIVARINPNYYVIETVDHILIEKQKSSYLFTTPISYRVSVSYDKRYVYATLWRGETLPAEEDIEAYSESMLAHFNAAVDALHDELKTMCGNLKIEESVIAQHIVRFLVPQLESSGNLKVKEKTRRRIAYHFQEYLKPLKEKKMREELLAKTIRDFKNLFPLARSLNRKITFHTGPTNSGKTYTALQKLRKGTTGYYLAPLRLLALEGYENLIEHGTHASLITGEEEIIDEESTHISSTIEMLNSDIDVDVCVIDEIQMINDRDRGWAWANALIGAPAREIILTGSTDAIEAVRKIAEYLEEELEVVAFERKNPLEVLQRPTPLKRIKPKTAVIAFSRKEVLSLKQQLASRYSVSVVYGNLSPEVRREEARKFRSGESDILVATDAIAMGLNLPIQTILFARDNKFDGLRRRELSTTEVLQISGRAGRYGIHEHGYVGGLSMPILKTITEQFHAPLPNITLPFSVMASLEHVMLIGEILESNDLLQILTFFADNMQFEGPFRAANIDSMLEIAAIVGEYRLDLCARYHLSCAPVSIGSPYIESVFHRYLSRLEKGEAVPYFPPRELPRYAYTNEELLNAEDRVKEVSLYLWLSFKFKEQFPDTEEAISARKNLNRFIEKSLQKGNFVKRCRRCNKALDLSYRFSICESCYQNSKRGSSWQRKHSNT